MTKIPTELHEHINDALFPETPMIGTVDADGYPRVSIRGSVCVFDDETIAIWERGLGGVNKNIRDGAKVNVYFQKYALTESLLPMAGVARFFGTATVHKDGPIRQQVWDMILAEERERDPEQKGYAILVNVERAEDLSCDPL